VTVSSDGRNVTEGTLDRASCEVDRYSLSDIKDDSRFTNIMQAANRSNVSFYPIGPSGFSSSASPLTPRRQSLQTMADMTDGLAVLEPSFLDSGIQRMVDDLSSYYLVGYYSAAKADGRFHKITVRVKRPGVQVRARARLSRGIGGRSQFARRHHHRVVARCSGSATRDAGAESPRRARPRAAALRSGCRRPELFRCRGREGGRRSSSRATRAATTGVGAGRSMRRCEPPQVNW
jgi:hypothetical protein